MKKKKPVRTAKKAATAKKVRRAGDERAVAKEPLAQKQARALRILNGLHSIYPEATCALTHKSPLELLVATILSAQCTDERVNMVTPNVFARYPTASDLAAARTEELEGIIRSTGFFRNKTKSIIGAARTIMDKFAGAVPSAMDQLLELPGVARKTANVVLGTWFGKNEGVVVDTHVGRLAHRLALTWRSRNEKDAVKIEQDLMEVFPQDSWTYASHALIWHGREVCSARKPACERCVLAKDCPSAFIFEHNALPAAKKPVKTDKASGKRSRR